LANRYVFAFQPTISVSVGNLTKTYGVDDTASLQSLASSTVSGLQAGVAGAFLGDTASSVYSGAPVLASAGAAAGANVGTYSITASLVLSDGYALAVTPGTMTVTPQTLLYNANAVSRTYGSANPGFGGTVAGFVNGDTLASATTGILAFASTATLGSGAGSFAITGSGLSAVNYVFAQNPANATALTITPATLTFTANPASRAFGIANPVFRGTVTGFVNGDTMASATTGTLVFTSPATSQSPAGSYAINGSGLNAANYTFVQAPANATALTIIDAPPPIQLQSFTNSIEPPPASDSANTPLGATQLSLIALPVVPPPPLPPLLPPGPPPVLSLLTGLSDTPIASDQTTTKMVASLDGDNASTSSGDSSGDVVIPNMLVNQLSPPAPQPADISALPSFGNSSLWQ
jgi:hypothetical protein